MPQGDVPSSRSCWMPLEMLSRSLRISCRFLVPRMFLSVVWASILVLWWLSSTLATEIVAFDTLKNTTASTDTVTLSLVRIWEFVGRSIYRKFWKILENMWWARTNSLKFASSSASSKTWANFQFMWTRTNSKIFGHCFSNDYLQTWEN